MKLGLFRQIVELNQSFDQLIARLTKLEFVPFFQRDLIQYARSGVEIARVYANREFFDSFEEIVEKDAKWAYRFQRVFDEKLKDRDDIYLEVRDSEQRRKRKRLPPRVVILPDWDMSDEDVLTKGVRARERVLRQKGVARLERSPRNRDHRFKNPIVSKNRKRGETDHEKGKANDLGTSAVRSRPSVSGFARESRGLG